MVALTLDADLHFVWTPLAPLASGPGSCADHNLRATVVKPDTRSLRSARPTCCRIARESWFLGRDAGSDEGIIERRPPGVELDRSLRVILSEPFQDPVGDSVPGLLRPMVSAPDDVASHSEQDAKRQRGQYVRSVPQEWCSDCAKGGQRGAFESHDGMPFGVRRTRVPVPPAFRQFDLQAPQAPTDLHRVVPENRLCALLPPSGPSHGEEARKAAGAFSRACAAVLPIPPPPGRSRGQPVGCATSPTSLATRPAGQVRGVLPARGRREDGRGLQRRGQVGERTCGSAPVDRGIRVLRVEQPGRGLPPPHRNRPPDAAAQPRNGVRRPTARPPPPGACPPISAPAPAPDSWRENGRRIARAGPWSARPPVDASRVPATRREPHLDRNVQAAGSTLISRRPRRGESATAAHRRWR